MGKIKISRAGGYDPAKGPRHPDNQDPTLERAAAMSPEIKLEAGRSRCYGCGGQAEQSLVIGHRYREGSWSGGSASRIALCPTCLHLLGEVLREAQERGA